MNDITFKKVINKVVPLGLRVKPNYDQLVSYIQADPERIRYPNRDAKFARNSYFFSNLLDNPDADAQQRNALEFIQEQAGLRELISKMGGNLAQAKIAQKTAKTQTSSSEDEEFKSPDKAGSSSDLPPQFRPPWYEELDTRRSTTPAFLYDMEEARLMNEEAQAEEIRKIQQSYQREMKAKELAHRHLNEELEQQHNDTRGHYMRLLTTEQMRGNQYERGLQEQDRTIKALEKQLETIEKEKTANVEKQMRSQTALRTELVKPPPQQTLIPPDYLTGSPVAQSIQPKTIPMEDEDEEPEKAPEKPRNKRNIVKKDNTSKREKPRERLNTHQKDILPSRNEVMKMNMQLLVEGIKVHSGGNFEFSKDMLKRGNKKLLQDEYLNILSKNPKWIENKNKVRPIGG